MSKLKNLVAETIKSMQAEISAHATGALEVTAKAPSVSAPKAAVVSTSLKSAGVDAERIGELAYIAKSVNKGVLSDADAANIDARFKAIGVTADIATLIPSGFTGALLRDIKSRLVVTAMFPMSEVTPGGYDSIALNGITGYLATEATATTQSAEAYTNMLYLVTKCMVEVAKSYEALDDAYINLAEEVRMGIIDALAEAIENAIVNGDDTATHMDAGVVAPSFAKSFKGLRKLALGKQTVDCGGAALTEANWLTYISSAQEKGGKYLDDLQVSMGNVVLLVPQNVYNQLRMFPSFLTKEKAGLGTLFGAEVSSIFGIPVVMTPYIPAAVDATGIVHATSGNNTLATAILVNRKFFKFYTTGTPLMESDRNISNQSVIMTGSVRCGFNGLFDRNATNPAAIDATRKTAVALINIDKI